MGPGCFRGQPVIFGIRDHRLTWHGAEVPFQPSPHGADGLVPRYLVLHYTAGTTARAAIDWFANPESEVSAHLVVDRDGAVTQMAGFDRVAWHAGVSAWDGLTGLNRHSIGIEIVNAGKLRRDGAGRWVNWAGDEIDPEHVVLATHRHEAAESGWHAFTPAQIAATVGIGVALRRRYGLSDVLGHDDIAPGRKIDPGPAFPMPSVRFRIMGRPTDRARRSAP